jgi:DNA-binding response OmpR family regulator
MGQSVLVVDTTDRQLGHITQTLRDQGYSPDVVQTEAELLEALEATDAQLVFFNLQVQGVLEICDSMRSSMAGAIVPAIFMGCGDDADSAIRSPADALSAGGDYYFAAPFDIPRVIAKVRTYVGLSQQDDAAVVDLGDLDRPGRHRLPEQAPPDPLVGASDAVLAAICDREAELASRRDESHDVYGGGQSHVEDGHGGSGDDAHLRGESHDGDGHAGRKSHGDGKGRDDYGRETKGGSGQRQDVLLPAAGPLEPSATAPAPAPVDRTPPPAAPAGGVAAAAATPAATTTYRPLSPASGHLSPSYDMARLLYDAFVQRVTGRIGLENGHAQTMVFFIDGAPTRVQSLQSAHRLEEYLLSTKKISLTHYQQVRLRGLRRSQQVKAFLLEKNVLGADVLEEALHTQLREQLMELFAYTTASFSYSP